MAHLTPSAIELVSDKGCISRNQLKQRANKDVLDDWKPALSDRCRAVRLSELPPIMQADVIAINSPNERKEPSRIAPRRGN